MRSTASLVRPASATTYTSGDIIANSGTGPSVVPLEFNLVMPVGFLSGATCTVTPASGNLVIANFDFDLLIFRPNTNIPFAAGSYPADNAALTLTEAMYADVLAIFPFVNGAWRNPLGALTAGATGRQESVMAVRALAQYDTLDLKKVLGLVQAKGAWDPGAVVNTLRFALDTSYE